MLFTFQDVSYKNILKNINLSISENKISIIIGESGSGKSTLLKLMNKMISCTSGKIFYSGKNIAEINSVMLRREVMMLSQTPYVFSGSVKDNLLMGIKFSQKKLLLDETSLEKTLYEILDLVLLKKYLSEDALKFSGGEKQRLALARILVSAPPVFILDEPTSNLDEKNSLQLIENVIAHAKLLKMSLIMVTHSKEIANKYADTIFEIENGTLKNLTNNVNTDIKIQRKENL